MVFEDGCSLGKSWEQGGSSGGKDGGSGGDDGEGWGRGEGKCKSTIERLARAPAARPYTCDNSDLSSVNTANKG